MAMTMAEKILARSAGKDAVSAGEIIDANVDVAMSHENAGMVLHHFKTIGADRVWDPERIVIVFDHRVPAESERTATSPSWRTCQYQPERGRLKRGSKGRQDRASRASAPTSLAAISSSR